jgi:hypothetical protein
MYKVVGGCGPVLLQSTNVQYGFASRIMQYIT